MARDQATITCPDGVWTQLTNADATAITFAVLSGSVFLRATTDTTTPTEDHGIPYRKGEGELQKTISELFYLASADRVWAKPMSISGGSSDQAAVYVDHA